MSNMELYELGSTRILTDYAQGSPGTWTWL